MLQIFMGPMRCARGLREAAAHGNAGNTHTPTHCCNPNKAKAAHGRRSFRVATWHNVAPPKACADALDQDLTCALM
jgi:hypothetical protein